MSARHGAQPPPSHPGHPTPLINVLPQALAADEDDAYSRSAWADPGALKQHFAGVGSVRIPR
jgi:hypothetical protein